MTLENPAPAPEAGADAAESAADTPVARFAAQLRALRETSGNPSYRHLARVMHYSPSTIADATAGRRLPTEPVVRAFATACGADADHWVRLLRDAASSQSAEATHTDPAGTDPAGTDPAGTDPAGTKPVDAEPSEFGATRRPATAWWSNRSVRMSLAAVGAAAFLLAGYGIGAATTGGKASQQPKTVVVTATPKPSYPAPDGADPIAAGCTADKRMLDKSALMRDGVQIGALELWYSERCRAGWSRVYLYPPYDTTLPDTLASVTVTAADGTSMSIAARLYKDIPNYTNVVAPHSGCLRASAVFDPDTATPARAEISCDTPPGSSGSK